MSIQSFTLALPQRTLDDLHQRVSLTRWPDEIPGVGWEEGTDLQYLRQLLSYWAGEFDWRAQERKLNAFKHFRAQLEGIHLSTLDLAPYTGPGSRPLSEAEREYLAQYQHWVDVDRGYGAIQSTRPQTLGYGLNDSPAGLAAWIVEKYRAWSDCEGKVERRFSKDQLLTTITIYWRPRRSRLPCAITLITAGSPSPWAWRIS